MSEEIKTALRRVFEDVIGKGDMAAAKELLSDDYVNYSMPVGGKGPEAFQNVIAMFRGGFPDLKIDLEDIIAEGEKVVSRGRWSGTHRGEFMGVPPTGRQVNVTFIDVWRREDGKFVENWVEMNIVGLMQQLGVMPGQG